MIRLVIEDYCNNCTMFEPEVVERPINLESFDGSTLCGDTIIKCVNCTTCKKLMEHLQTKFREESAQKIIGLNDPLFANEERSKNDCEEICCSNCKSYMCSSREEPCRSCFDFSQFH